MSQVKRLMTRWMLVFSLVLAVGAPLIYSEAKIGVGNRLPMKMLCDGDPGTCPCPNC